MGFEIKNGVLLKYTEESGVTEVTVPEGVTAIGDSAFKKCTRLTSITIPESVTAIRKNAFKNCTSLTSIRIPNSVTFIGKYAFYGCESLHCIPMTAKYTVQIPQSLDHDAFFALWDDIIRMLENKDFAVRMPLSVKYAVVCSLFCGGERSEELFDYIKKNLAKIMSYVIEQQNESFVVNLINYTDFISKRNIDKFITLATEQQANEITAILLNHKNAEIGTAKQKELRL